MSVLSSMNRLTNWDNFIVNSWPYYCNNGIQLIIGCYITCLSCIFSKTEVTYARVLLLCKQRNETFILVYWKLLLCCPVCSFQSNQHCSFFFIESFSHCTLEFTLLGISSQGVNMKAENLQNFVLFLLLSNVTHLLASGTLKVDKRVWVKPKISAIAHL